MCQSSRGPYEGQRCTSRDSVVGRPYSDCLRSRNGEVEGRRCHSYTGGGTADADTNLAAESINWSNRDLHSSRRALTNDQTARLEGNTEIGGRRWWWWIATPAPAGTSSTTDVSYQPPKTYYPKNPNPE